MLKVPSILGESGIEGIGVFVTCDVKKGTTVWTFSEAVDFRRGDFPDWLAKYVFTDSTVAAIDGDNARFISHADSPNLISSGPDLVAARDLTAWEELTVDYNDPESKMTISL